MFNFGAHLNTNNMKQNYMNNFFLFKQLSDL
jgi:hypothetical protein